VTTREDFARTARFHTSTCVCQAPPLTAGVSVEHGLQLFMVWVFPFRPSVLQLAADARDVFFGDFLEPFKCLCVSISPFFRCTAVPRTSSRSPFWCIFFSFCLLQVFLCCHRGSMIRFSPGTPFSTVGLVSQTSSFAGRTISGTQGARAPEGSLSETSQMLLWCVKTHTVENGQAGSYEN